MRVYDLTETEKLLLRGLDARRILLEPTINQFYKDQDYTVGIIAERLEIPIVEFKQRFSLNPETGKVTETAINANTIGSDDYNAGSSPVN